MNATHPPATCARRPWTNRLARLFGRDHEPSSKRVRKQPKPTRLGFEGLETRDLLSAVPVLQIPAMSPPISLAPVPQVVIGSTISWQVIEQQKLGTPAMRQQFPNLWLGSYPNFKVLGPSTFGYNCIAHSLGIHDRWVDPITSPGPNKLAGMDQMYATQGYVRLPTMDFRLQNRIEKVVVYAKTDSFGRTEVTHAAKQERILTPFGVQGVWTSKLGALALIQHTSPHSVNGPAYGQPVAVYARFV